MFCATTTLCLSLALYSKFVDITINVSLILKKTGIQKHFPLSGFFSIDSLAASALQEAAGYAISRPNNLELHLGCHTCWLSYFTLVCLWCGRTVERTVTWLPNFVGWVDYHIFLPKVLRCALFARESSATNECRALTLSWVFACLLLLFHKDYF